jgi:hypothetical protein
MSKTAIYAQERLAHQTSTMTQDKTTFEKPAGIVLVKKTEP